MKRSDIGIIPDQVIDETILTLNLLFPDWDTDTIKFFKKKKNKHHHILIAEPAYYPAPIRLNEFSFWRDRLHELYVEFNSPPPAWKQLWKDRRNPLQWYTFWFAILTLGLVTILELLHL
ncbi:uncharacterized protein K444DRAFT_615108 [Hyaloscypha bicolor E]|uniref:Uncharacterized protein n=1 Tax=Hyaloscypha bicolor E TaxID=1095630 RepID=A0A2J6T3U5_9HELO|nr:uncharacterized protein K444DRAFT_615108 [Hyaloscypha bicolor E]PMD57711.1 hypothetical protein K444DRAFT_615108 [Hyaloscypha bicolor E]